MDLLAVTTSSVRVVRSSASVAPFSPLVFFIISLISIAFALGITYLVMHKTFQKAGYKGWECIVPIYNMYCIYKMADVSVALFVVSLFVPIINIYAYIELAKKFGKSAGFGIGLFFLNVIFFAILSYGDAKYEGKKISK